MTLKPTAALAVHLLAAGCLAMLSACSVVSPDATATTPELPTVETPVITTSANSSGFQQTIAISCPDSAATIYCQTEAAGPWTQYGGPISVFGHGITKTISAYATRSDYQNSPTATKTVSTSSPTLHLTTVSSKSCWNQSVFGYDINGMVTDGATMFAVTETAIIKIDLASNVQSLFAGHATETGSADGAGTAARFSSLYSLVSDGINLYTIDIGSNYTIRRINIGTAAVTTFAGTTGSHGNADGPPGTATLSQYGNKGLATDGKVLYLPDSEYNRIRTIDLATGVVTTITDTVGPGEMVNLSGGVVYSNGAVYMTGSHCILKYDIANKECSLFAGSSNAGTPGFVDGQGSTARFSSPTGLVSDGTYLYVSDMLNSRVRRIAIATAMVSTFTGTGAATTLDGSLASATTGYPRQIATDGTKVYFKDQAIGASGKLRVIE